jgi:aryl-alcohol dehydrogenase-like predicted oxidoreductase
MQPRPLGQTGLPISPIVFGGNVFGWTADKTASFALLDRLLEAGLTSIDTADRYSAWVPGHQGGESETVIGEWMAARGTRQRMQIITKVGMEVPGNPAPHQGLSAGYIAQAVEASLKRLRTDHIDVYLSHRFDDSVPQAETLGAYDQLIRAGKVRAVGASNFTATQLQEALALARTDTLPRYAVLQPEYSLMERTSFEGPLRDLALAENLAVITYYSLASGFLTGKYRGEADLGQSPRGAAVKKYLNPRGLRVLAALDEVAGRHPGAQLGEVALAWLMARPGVTAPIASATSVAQVDSLVRATQLKLTAEDMAQLNQASAPASAEGASGPYDGPVSTATITTVEPARIILRLCKHWGHKWPVRYDEHQGQVDLSSGRVLMTAGDGELRVRLEGVAGADMLRLEEVVAEHAQRMARDETFQWDWARQGG